MNDQQLLRYSRHILLPEIGIEGQEKLISAHALIIGAGGLGSPAALFLAASGVGTLTICDNDTVDLTNLQRQILHRTSSVGKAKVASALSAIADINPEITVNAISERIANERMFEMVSHADVVLDCSDNFNTRYALNRACVQLKKPLVSGAAIRFAGQVSVFDMRYEDSPCYQCLYPENAENEDTRCAEMGIFAPLVGVVGSLQAGEALKLISGAGQTLNGKLLLIDALNSGIRTIKMPQDKNCVVCGKQ
jgi:molybdopterin-synthase adenylyltransferase